MYKRLGHDYQFDSNNMYSMKLIVLFTIGSILGIFEIIIAFINYSHYLGFTSAAVLLILALVGFWYLSRIPKNKRDRTCFWLPTTKKNKLYSRLFFFTIYLVFMVLVFLFIIIKIINFAKNPHLRGFPEECLPSNGCARVMIFKDNHRDYHVGKFNINHAQFILNP